MRRKTFILIGIWLIFYLVRLTGRAQCVETDESSPATIQTGEPAEQSGSNIVKRITGEKQTSDLPYILTPHRLNYLLPFAYNSSLDTKVYKDSATEILDLDQTEVKFQFSIKYMLVDNVLNANSDFYIAYTNLSYWQAYNNDLSSPFRDTNHEPEAWLQWNKDWEILGVKARLMQLGICHQSNGRAEPLSRSWNRIYTSIILEKGGLAFGIKPWYRIPEDKAEDNNPDISKYYGYGEFHAAYKMEDHTLSLMLRNNLRSSDNKGAVEFGWCFPLYKKVKGYIQYFNGYGQSLLDYNHSANTVGVGIALSDIL